MKKELRIQRLLVFLMLIFSFLSALTGIIKFPELQRFFLFVYDRFTAAEISWVHDYSGLVLVFLILLRLIVKRRWLREALRTDFRLPQRKNIAAILLILVAAIGILAWGRTRFSDYRKAASLAAVEVKDYKGEKLGSVNDFRENSIKGVQHVDKGSYNLEISGLVDKPLKLGYEDVLKLPAYQKVVTLDCVEGWSVKALWEGVLVKDILKLASVKPEADTIIFYAADGYSTSFPLDFINGDIMMADKINGLVLPEERGFPFQLVAEQKWGYKWIKWITKIELSSDSSYQGFWESRGYNNNGDLSGSKYSD